MWEQGGQKRQSCVADQLALPLPRPPPLSPGAAPATLNFCVLCSLNFLCFPGPLQMLFHLPGDCSLPFVEVTPTHPPDPQRGPSVGPVPNCLYSFLSRH